MPDEGGAQWVDYGVNVGRNVIGDIHIHTVRPSAEPPLFRSGPTSAFPVLRPAAFRSALVGLGRACERAASTLSSPGLLGPERRNNELE
ncbi:hypothetical protein [Kitasatospora sp. CB02891]|uniref:hypothetical protein n=1 Tax=Kitasatospora sp. CB02891 TaxID=2020329 RepID=UPI000C27D767|nr:hypothetical protein [Kitasatospora sp. CB02891]PJN28202.1 hypothetical protein CG736_08560 [Kitasatospora sp. CB02891]